MLTEILNILYVGTTDCLLSGSAIATSNPWNKCCSAINKNKFVPKEYFPGILKYEYTNENLKKPGLIRMMVDKILMIKLFSWRYLN